MGKSVIWGAVTFLCLSAGTAISGTLEEVKARGTLNCGVSTRLPGFAAPDANDNWDGFDVAVCRAVANAVLGDPQAVTFFPTNPRTRFPALSNGEVDLLARNTTWTFTRDVEMDFTFAGINYYDGQGFLVPKDSGFTSARELDGARICVQTGTSSELNLADYFRTNGLDYEAVVVDSTSQAQEAYLAGECMVYSSDASQLAATRATFETPANHVLLPEIISKEPLGPLVRQDDAEWADVVRWVLNALITGEELGVTSANLVELAQAPTDNPEINRLLGTEGALGAMLGLDPDWAVKALSGGNYGEIFEKNIGENTPIGLARGLNAQWTNGGLIYSPPFR